MKVLDGGNVTLKCIGIVSDSKCVIMEKEINFGLIPVCKKVTATISIKNQ